MSEESGLLFGRSSLAAATIWRHAHSTFGPVANSKLATTSEPYNAWQDSQSEALARAIVAQALLASPEHEEVFDAWPHAEATR